jgi:hypothetical protein
MFTKPLATLTIEMGTNAKLLLLLLTALGHDCASTTGYAGMLPLRRKIIQQGSSDYIAFLHLAFLKMRRGI